MTRELLLFVSEFRKMDCLNNTSGFYDVKANEMYFNRTCANIGKQLIGSLQAPAGIAQFFVHCVCCEI